MTPSRLYSAYVFDLDGTVYLGDALLPTAGETLAQLRALGRRTLYFSNNPTQPREAYARKLSRLGVPTSPDEVLTSTQVLIEFLQARHPGARLFVVGEPPLCDALRAAGFDLAADSDGVVAVIASFDRTFTYHKLQAAFDAVRAGARFFATNGDRFCPVPGGGQPDAAAIIAAIEACTGARCEAVVGKPSRFAVDAILRHLARSRAECLIVGDRLETDIQMGVGAGIDAALALTGATTEADVAASTIRPTYILRRLADLLP
jgi:NagD protein